MGTKGREIVVELLDPKEILEVFQVETKSLTESRPTGALGSSLIV